MAGFKPALDSISHRQKKTTVQDFPAWRLPNIMNPYVPNHGPQCNSSTQQSGNHRRKKSLWIFGFLAETPQ